MLSTRPGIVESTELVYTRSVVICYLDRRLAMSTFEWVIALEVGVIALAAALEILGRVR